MFCETLSHEMKCVTQRRRSDATTRYLVIYKAFQNQRCRSSCRTLQNVQRLLLFGIGEKVLARQSLLVCCLSQGANQWKNTVRGEIEFNLKLTSKF